MTAGSDRCVFPPSPTRILPPMTLPEHLSFDSYLDVVFASPNWLDACASMLSAFVETIDLGDLRPN